MAIYLESTPARQERAKKIRNCIANYWSDSWEDDWKIALIDLCKIYFNGYSYRPLNDMTLDELESFLLTEEDFTCQCTNEYKGDRQSDGSCSNCGNCLDVDSFIDIWDKGQS